MRVVAVVQARTLSSRLPGKVLAPIGDVTMIERMIRQLRGAKTLDEIVIATSDDGSDDELAGMLAAVGVKVFRGDLEDVLGRYDAASEWA
nr:hypothetical protein [Gemmatimonadaceae bacterium]